MLFNKSTVSYLIVGLGNPESKYDCTRHNVGFMVADRLAERHSCRFEKKKFNAIFGRIKIGGQDCLLVKPQTYMNNSGSAVRDLAAFHKIPSERIIVIADDISLPVGKIRIRQKGSAGGHNGLKDIIALAGGEGFPRVKVGVGQKPHPDYDLAAWVLSRFKSEEQAALKSAIDDAADAAELIIAGKITQAMNKFN